ncbi:hypothetical protein JAAARDRAFT_197214 [Jaapia argillacea MUCL 33604]|uniref:Uncharacterized protein n=1 Tax=Jaapia argillacea MUCL 33604 TaxID=933084 RepID=A0A067PFT4_9AGAM|nr:hypothetical protein JAAARDRAFT_197214 [Jaapia argillacea MUCL 33604]
MLQDPNINTDIAILKPAVHSILTSMTSSSPLMHDNRPNSAREVQREEGRKKTSHLLNGWLNTQVGDTQAIDDQIHGQGCTVEAASIEGDSKVERLKLAPEMDLGKRVTAEELLEDETKMVSEQEEHNEAHPTQTPLWTSKRRRSSSSSDTHAVHLFDCTGHNNQLDLRLFNIEKRWNARLASLHEEVDQLRCTHHQAWAWVDITLARKLFELDRDINRICEHLGIRRQVDLDNKEELRNGPLM